MSILSDFEDSVSRAVEGMFAGVFRSAVQPAELARALGKEMDRERVVGVGKVYAPTLYTILISPADDEKLGAFTTTLVGELTTYLISYASEHGYELSTRPVVRFLVDDGLKLGRFEAYAELVSPEELAQLRRGDAVSGPPPAPVPADGVVPPRAAAPPASPPAPAPPPVPPADIADATTIIREGDGPTATVTFADGRTHQLRGDRVEVGRLDGCGICIKDRNVSRTHAAFVRDGDGWAIQDLGSTNGTLLNGTNVSRAHLSDGDEITIGITELTYREREE